MQNTILQICKQIHELLPSHRIAITRFVGKYEYGQIYVGELDRDIKREPCGFMFAKRDFCVVYSQDPVKEQETARSDFEFVCQTLEDHCAFLFNPRWYKTFFDVYETTLILEFQVWERYERYKGIPDPTMEGSDFYYPMVVYDGGGDEPEPTPPPPDRYARGVDSLDGTFHVRAVTAGTSGNNLRVQCIRNSVERYRLITYRTATKLADTGNVVTNVNLVTYGNEYVTFTGVLPESLAIGGKTDIFLSGGIDDD